MRFCPTKAFFLCLIALPILLLLNSFVGLKATGPCGPMQSESCVQ